MNKILQKRIEEAAKKYNARAYSPFDDPFELSREFEHDCHCFREGAAFALQNQWISVEEALPEDKEDVFVRNEYGGCTAAWYSRNTKDWHLTCGEIFGDDIIGSKITHWMEIPSLEGGEK